MYINYHTYSYGSGWVGKANCPMEWYNWHCSECDWMVPGTVTE